MGPHNTFRRWLFENANEVGVLTFFLFAFAYAAVRVAFIIW